MTRRFSSAPPNLLRRKHSKLTSHLVRSDHPAAALELSSPDDNFPTHVAGYQGHLLVLDALEKWGRTLSEAPTEVDHLTEIAGRALMEQAGFDFL